MFSLKFTGETCFEFCYVRDGDLCQKKAIILSKAFVELREVQRGGRKERDILEKESIVGLRRNLELWKLSRIQKDDPN